MDILYYQQSNLLPVVDPMPIGGAFTNLNPKPSGAQHNMRFNICQPNEHRFLSYYPALKLDLLSSAGFPTSWSYDPSTGNQDCTANTAYWGAKKTHDYFISQFNWKGWNNQRGGLTIDIDVNSHTSYGRTVEDRIALTPGSGAAMANHFYNTLGLSPDAWVIGLGRGHIGSLEKPKVTLDIIGHEFVHGINEASAKLYNNLDPLNPPEFDEEGIIMEGFCDIFGIVIESKYKPNDWILGNDVGSNEYRSFSNPNNSNSVVNVLTSTGGIQVFNTGPQPDFYKGLNWAFPTVLPNTQDGHEIYIHHNTGIMNFWFYAISEGVASIGFVNYVGDTYTFSGIGLDKAARITFKTLTKELGKPEYVNKDFKDLRKATLKVTEDLYDACSEEWETVRLAWDAVGVYGDECELSYKVTTTPVTYEESCDCSATIDVCGLQSSSYNIQWYDSDKNEIASPIMGNIEELCSGTYTFKITSGDCEKEGSIDCSKRSTGEVPSNSIPIRHSPTATPPVLLPPQINTYCTTGDIDISVLGGVPPYTYTWSNGATSQDLTGVVGGTYYVTVSSSGVGDIAVIGGPYTVMPSGPTVTSNLNVPCAGGGATAGSVSLNISNGTPPYSILWSNGSTASTFFVFGEPSGGFPSQNASVTVTDANGCVFTDSYMIEPHEISLTGFASKSCVAFSDGYISAWGITANPPLSYQWSTGATTSSITNLAPGSYSVVVTDAVGCVKSKNFTVAVETPTLVPNTVGDICEVQEFCHGNATGPIQDVTQTGPEFVPDFAAPSNSICQITETCPYDDTHQIPLALGMISNPIVAESFLFNPELPEDFNCYEKIVCQIPGFPTEEASFFLGAATGGPCEIVDVGPDLYECCQVLCNGVHVNWACRKLVIVAPPPPINGGVFTVYPSPFQDYLTIEFESIGQEDAIISIYNNLGQQVHQEVQQTIIGLNAFTLNLVGKVNNGFY